MGHIRRNCTKLKVDRETANNVSDVSDDDVALGVSDDDWFSEIGNVLEGSKSDSEKTEESFVGLANPFESDELAAFVGSNPVLKLTI
jgi:hypothetical protein